MNESSDYTEMGLSDFSNLTPNLVLELVEQATQRHCTNLCRPLTSYINRVYETEMEDGDWIVIKFYRPGRWSLTALQDEHDFVSELVEAEIPVVAPIQDMDGNTLHCQHGMYYTIFPKRGGRALDEPSEAQWLEVGRLIARVHSIGADHSAKSRIQMSPAHSTEDQIVYLLDHHFENDGIRRSFEQTVDDILDLIEPLFDEASLLRIHGDCHKNNILCRPDEPLTLIDFDDMAEGPAVQDFWMLLPGHLKDSQRELNLFLEGYETFRPFNRATLRLIEPLRFMRMIHYLAWCARQKDDGGFARLSPDWGSDAFWRQEIQDLRIQHQEILDALGA